MLKIISLALEYKKSFCLDVLSFSYRMCVKSVGCGMGLHVVKTVRRSCYLCILSCKIKFITFFKNFHLDSNLGLLRSNHTPLVDEISYMSNGYL